MIHFVGAGCGAKDLITVRGKEHIENADVIVYAGSLVNKELLTYNVKNAKVYDSAYMTLEEVMSVLLDSEKEGKYIVRLHTGDPSMYGAIKEQMDILSKEGIEYDVTPGVSAAFGAAASLKVEYTLPDVSQTLILTRMSGKTLVPEKESIKSLASHKATMAVYLSASLSKELQRELIEGGYEENTPAAVCVKVSWDDEKIYRCTVGTIEKTTVENGITKTCIYIIGDSIDPTTYDESRLYAADFSTEYRKATK
ncbi:MAG: precorrin-4 C(11)-methyltransferase [Lachnospiraceae bacterium]|nr:precorrin-4 C(11)-methyltransferase [Lachnospiraceae bacterium]